MYFRFICLQLFFFSILVGIIGCSNLVNPVTNTFNYGNDTNNALSWQAGYQTTGTNTIITLFVTLTKCTAVSPVAELKLWGVTDSGITVDSVAIIQADTKNYIPGSCSIAGMKGSVLLQEKGHIKDSVVVLYRLEYSTDETGLIMTRKIRIKSISEYFQ